jgi:hypothetical protein
VPFETDQLLEATESLPKDEYSVNSASREFGTEDEAKSYFLGLKQRARDLEEWSKSSGLSSYAQFDESGKKLSSEIIEQDRFLRITLAGAGKSDWVRVKRIYEGEDEVVITVKPTFDPTEFPQKTGEISHFFGAVARNNFCFLRNGKAVSVYVIGLNEKPNTDHTAGLIESARNAAVANLGYYLGIQKAEWKRFCESFLKDDYLEKK